MTHFFLIAAVAIGAGIQGPTKAVPGDLVVLSTDHDAKTHKWDLVDSEKTFWVSPDQRTCLFSTGDVGKFTFYLVCVHDDGSVDTHKHTLTVEQIGPTPPQPGPNPGPDPPNPGPNPGPLPDGRFKASQAAYDNAQPIGEPAKAKELAKRLKAIESSISAGGLKSPQEAINECGKAMDDTIGPATGKWGPFRAWVRSFIDDLIKGSKLRSVHDLAALFEEIATGLEACK